MIPMTNLDYVELYAIKMKDDPRLFAQQKRFLESQLKSSAAIFKGMEGKNFKKQARKYLRGIGLISKQLKKQ